MNYQIKVKHTQEGYTGYVLLAGEVIFSTSNCRDQNTASAQVNSFIKEQNAASKQNKAALRRIPGSVEVADFTVMADPNNARPTTKGSCCGRG